jgi:hypothetical protein
VRFWIGKRFKLPVVGGFYAGVSFAFHPPTRVLVRQGSAQPGPVARFLGYAVALGFLAMLAGAIWVNCH